jgi:hypothetical protein
VQERVNAGEATKIRILRLMFCFFLWLCLGSLLISVFCTISGLRPAWEKTKERLGAAEMSRLASLSRATERGSVSPGSPGTFFC